MLRRWIAAALLCAGAAPASAEIFAAPPTFQLGQQLVVCRVLNVGSTNVTFRRRLVLAELGTVSLPIGLSCTGATLAPGGTCVWQARVVTGGAHACVADVSSKATLRGTMSISGVDTITQLEME